MFTKFAPKFHTHIYTQARARVILQALSLPLCH